jgi:signal transduction histidine kinase
MIESYYERLSPEEIYEHLASLIKTGERMSTIIESLLLLSRVYQLEDVAVDILDMETYVDEAIEQVTSGLSLALEVEIDMPEAWPWVVGYGPWIAEVWVNYITNAIKYGGVPPYIELGFDATFDADRTDADQTGAPQEIRFWVRDEGPGLTEEQQQHLFKPFVRLNPAQADGSGLGLTIVKQIVEKLGGRVGVESEPGAGCTFWFTLPSVDGALWESSVNLSAEETRVQR